MEGPICNLPMVTVLCPLMYCEVANKFDEMVILFMPPLNNGKIVLLLSLLMAVRPFFNKVFIAKRSAGGWETYHRV